jgi:hypothetical protein
MDAISLADACKPLGEISRVHGFFAKKGRGVALSAAASPSPPLN